MDALPDQSSFAREVRKNDDEARYQSGNLILWIAAIAVLIGLNAASWSFCMWVFGQPEHPMNYRLLTQLEKLDPIEGFTRVSAPRGKFYSTKDLYTDVYSFSPTELMAYNGILKRSYIKNYIERGEVVFLSGDFRVESVQRMGEQDVFQSGMVIRGRSIEFPDGIIDLALPSQELPESFALRPGDTLRISESTTCAVLLNIHRLENEAMIFTVVPLVTKTLTTPPEPKSYEFADGAVIRVLTPGKIQIDPERWPISDDIEEIEVKPVGVMSVKESEEIESTSIESLSGEKIEERSDD
ncbi:MAG: hypothetical protein ACPGIH_00390 [Verrucomicrobiales bacterium]